MKQRIRILIVDDSAFMCRTIRQLLTSDPTIEVVGEAADGLMAVRLVEQIRPDVVTMDVTMPRADGLSAVERIMAERPTPIVMLSSSTAEGSADAVRALELGAIDCVAKPSGSVDLGLAQIRDELVRKVKIAARVRVVRTVAPRSPEAAPERRPSRVPLSRPDAASRPRTLGSIEACVLIAASTGGPAVLLELIPRLPAELPAAVLIAQHMPAAYTAQLATMLADRSALPVHEARAGQRVQAGTVVVAPGSRDLSLGSDGTIRLHTPRPRAEGCPSADLLMTTAAEVYGAAVVGVVLTGMGRDGVVGARAIHAAGGVVVAQDEATSLVFGMPRAVVETGCVRWTVPLERLSSVIEHCVGLVATARGSHAS